MQKIKLFLATALLTLSMGITAFAGAWQPQETGQLKYQNDDGTYPVNTWQWIDGNNDGIAENYYFDVNGNLLVNGTTPDGNTVDANGAWIINGIVQTKQMQPASNTVPSTTVSQETSSSAPSGDTVWISESGKKYHSKASCSGMKNPSEVSLSDAQAAGRTACSKCY